MDFYNELLTYHNTAISNPHCLQKKKKLEMAKKFVGILRSPAPRRSAVRHMQHKHLEIEVRVKC